MRNYLMIIVCVCLIVTTLKCGGTKTIGSSSADPQTRFDFGRSTTVESLKRVIANTLRKYNHDLQISENLIETRWRSLAPTEQEAVRGIKETRYKSVVTFSARRNISTADLRLRYEARHASSDWAKTNPNQEIVAFIKNMQDEVKQELNRFLPQW